MNEIEDKNGRRVTVGSKVKVTHIDLEFVISLPEEEGLVVASMLNQTLEVYEVDEYGHAWVEKIWRRGEGMYESHSLALSSSEMELVESAPPNST